MKDKYRVKVCFNNGIIKEFIGDNLTIKPNKSLYLYKDGVAVYGIPMRKVLYYEIYTEEFPFSLDD